MKNRPRNHISSINMTKDVRNIITEYCKKHNIYVTDFVSAVLRDAVKNNFKIIKTVKIEVVK